MVRRNPKEIERIAAEWLARRGGDLSSQEEVAFREWLAADPRHLGAYARAEALMAHLERAGAAGADALRLEAEAPEPSMIARWGVDRRRFIWGGSMIAGLAAAMGAVVWLPRLMRESYSTILGETREVVLSDGSMLTLNTASKVLVDYSKRERRIVLMAGEALFDVAKNKARPFVVTAGDTSVRVVGTSFTVRHLETSPIQVLVREGIVEVSKPSLSGIAPLRITANTMAVAQEDQTIAARALPATQIQRQLAWQDGHIAFEGETLAEAAAQFARYSDTRIVIEDASLAREEIAGLFKATDPVGFARTIAISLNAHAKVAEGEVRLTR